MTDQGQRRWGQREGHLVGPAASRHAGRSAIAGGTWRGGVGPVSMGQRGGDDLLGFYGDFMVI